MAGTFNYEKMAAQKLSFDQFVNFEVNFFWVTSLLVLSIQVYVQVYSSIQKESSKNKSNSLYIANFIQLQQYISPQKKLDESII